LFFIVNFIDFFYRKKGSFSKGNDQEEISKVKPPLCININEELKKANIPLNPSINTATFLVKKPKIAEAFGKINKKF